MADQPPVERVPLTDEQLDRLEEASRQFEVFSRSEVHALIAELRASRAREQELRTEYDEATQELATDLAEERTLTQSLQQRIGSALAKCDSGLARRGVATEQLAGLVRAALTGTETAPEQRQQPERLKCLMCAEPGDYGGFCRRHCQPGAAPDGEELCR